MPRGKFITLEGGEGAGKSTSLTFIEHWLEQVGKQAVVTREPGGTDLGERVRELLLHARELDVSPEAELLLVFAARADHLRKVIEPALAAGQIVVCDRFTDASYAYQGGGRGIEQERIGVLENWVQDGLRPDVTLLFDVPVEIGLARANRRSVPDRFEREHTGFFERVRGAYLAAAAREPERIRVIDASQPPEAVEAKLAEILEGLFRG